ncbi:MAG: ISAs1 family transposase [Nostoc sp.]|uniref:ISAs1 family transposase n=1 Tax=Nostoc sp. TaxID=1180 RepID=UPI002FF81A88
MVSVIAHIAGSNDWVLGLPTIGGFYQNTQTWLIVQRECKVFAVPEQIQKKWSGLKTFVVIERQGERNGQPFYERQSYICSQCLEAQQLLSDIHLSWGIENRLHWVRDVIFQEDFPPRRGGNAPVNWSILHTFFITIARKLCFRTFLKHNVPSPTNCTKFFLSLYETTLR